jgi:hypothetical protein
MSGWKALSSSQNKSSVAYLPTALRAHTQVFFLVIFPELCP